MIAQLLAVVAASASLQAPPPPRLYVSLPFQGPVAAESESMLQSIRRAVEEAGTPHGVELVVRDDASRRANGWDPPKVAANARRAAEDPRAIGYIGEFNSGASAISMPLLNEAGILQVSPSNTYVGLTRREAAEPGEPVKYRPAGIQTYGRVAPADHLQAAAMVKAIGGRKRLFLVHDRELYGRQMVDMVARRTKVRVVGRAAWPGRIARRVRRARPDAIVFGGTTVNRAAELWRVLHRARPRARLYGFDGVFDSTFSGGIPRATRRLTTLTHLPFPYERYAYEAARVIVDALAAHGPDREAIREAFFATRNRDSAVGRYSIDRNGDVTRGRYGLYDGRLRPRRVITVP